MKNTILLFLSLLSLQLIAQTPQDILKGKSSGVKLIQNETDLKNDSIPNVVYLKEKAKNKDVLFFLNGQAFTEHGLEMIDPNDIASIKVEKDTMVFNDQTYTGMIYIQTKESYQPKLVSLNELKAKYITLEGDAPTLFIIDDKVIDKNYDTFKVDEKFILSIEVQSVKNTKEGLAINVIKLISRSKENQEQAKFINVKGN